MKKEERPKQPVKTVKQDKPNLLKQMEKTRRKIDQSKEKDLEIDEKFKRGEDVIKKMVNLQQQNKPKRTIDDLLKIEIMRKDKETQCELKKEMFKLLVDVDINKFTKNKIDSLNSWLGYWSGHSSLKKDKLDQLEYAINSWKKRGYKSIYECVYKEKRSAQKRREQIQKIGRTLEQINKSKEKDLEIDEKFKRGKNVIKNMENLKSVSQRLERLKKAKQEIEKRIQKIEREYKSLL
jgi:hypothetical protein